MTKEDYAYTLATLLCLDRPMQAELMKLSIETLAKMYAMYIQNAKDANAKVENAYKQVVTSSGDKYSNTNPYHIGLGKNQV